MFCVAILTVIVRPKLQLQGPTNGLAERCKPTLPAYAWAFRLNLSSSALPSSPVSWTWQGCTIVSYACDACMAAPDCACNQALFPNLRHDPPNSGTAMATFGFRLADDTSPLYLLLAVYARLAL